MAHNTYNTCMVQRSKSVDSKSAAILICKCSTLHVRSDCVYSREHPTEYPQPTCIPCVHWILPLCSCICIPLAIELPLHAYMGIQVQHPIDIHGTIIRDKRIGNASRDDGKRMQCDVTPSKNAYCSQYICLVSCSLQASIEEIQDNYAHIHYTPDTTDRTKLYLA